MKNIYCVIILLLAVALTGCNRDDFNRSDHGDSLGQNAPDSEVSGATILLSDMGKVTSEIMADKIIQYNDIDSTMAYVLTIKNYDTLGHVNSTVTGDSSVIRENTRMYIIYGNVIVVTEDGTKLETDKLHWNPKTDKIHTDSFVRITTSDGVVSGWGMEADQKIKSYKILHQVSGEYDDAGKLVEP